jgi:hypothetical protein
LALGRLILIVSATVGCALCPSSTRLLTTFTAVDAWKIFVTSGVLHYQQEALFGVSKCCLQGHMTFFKASSVRHQSLHSSPYLL